MFSDDDSDDDNTFGGGPFPNNKKNKFARLSRDGSNFTTPAPPRKERSATLEDESHGTYTCLLLILILLFGKVELYFILWLKCLNVV